MTSLVSLPFKVAGFAATVSLRIAGAAVDVIVDQIAGRQRPTPGAPPSPPGTDHDRRGDAVAADLGEPLAEPDLPPSARPAPPRRPAPRRTPTPTELRGSSADEETSEAPGPEIRVDEPWPGYGEMRAPDIIDRLAAADEAQKAVVLLYEQAHRARKTVLRAARKP